MRSKLQERCRARFLRHLHKKSVLGVILGLLLPTAAQATDFAAKITGAQEVPSVATGASGTGIFSLTSEGLAFNLTVQGLSGPIQAAHFHSAVLGVNGPVVRTISFTGNAASGTWTSADPEPLTPVLIDELVAGRIYVNVHTTANPGGEIRGQLIPSARIAELDGAQEVPSVSTTATGLGFFSLTSEGLTFNLIVRDLSGPIQAAHFHNAALGTNGPVVRTISFTGNAASGTWTSTDPEPLTPALIDELVAGRMYVNVHTTANPNGEIRGQIAPPPFPARLDGAQEVPSVATGASGTGIFSLTSEGLAFNLTVQGLSGSIQAAHFHNAALGVNGPVVRTISFTGNAASGTWTSADPEPLTPALIDELVAGRIYVNVHTTANPNGEIRGQIVAPTTFAAVLPTSRSGQVGTPLTVFGTMLHAGSPTAAGCRIVPLTIVPATFTFQTTDPATNAVTGIPDAPVDIEAGSGQTFVFAFTPTAPFPPTDVQLNFSCENSSQASVISGVNTLLLSASATPVPDIVALGATLTNDGIVNIPGTTGAGVFAVATVNVGASGSITALADTGTAILPVNISLCQTNPATGQCISAVGPSVTATINANETPTFGIFLQGSGNVLFDPAVNRVFVRFEDGDNVIRGSTSVAVRTE